MSLQSTSTGNPYVVKLRLRSISISAETGYHLQKWKPSVWKRGSGAKPEIVAKSRLASLTRFLIYLDEPEELPEVVALPLVNMKNSSTFASLA